MTRHSGYYQACPLPQHPCVLPALSGRRNVKGDQRCPLYFVFPKGARSLWALVFQLEETRGDFLPTPHTIVYPSWLMEREVTGQVDPESKLFRVSQISPKNPQVNLWLLRFLHLFTGPKLPTLKGKEALDYIYPGLICIFKKGVEGSIFYQKEIKPCLSSTRGIAEPFKSCSSHSIYSYVWPNVIEISKLNFKKKIKKSQWEENHGKKSWNRRVNVFNGLNV